MQITEKQLVWNDCTFRIQHLKVNNLSPFSELVFLHDALGSIPQWKSFPLALVKKSHKNAVIIERQGHGKSCPFSKKREITYLHDEAWKVLPGLCKILDIKNPVLIGHSDGGTIALLYGSKFPVKSIISIAAHIFVEEITRKSIKQATAIKADWVPKLQKYHGEKAEQLFDAWVDTWLSPDFEAFNIEKEISELHAPLLLVQSKDDEYGSMDQVKQIIKNVQSEIVETWMPEKGGHAPHLRDEDGIVNIICKFLQPLDHKYK